MLGHLLTPMEEMSSVDLKSNHGLVSSMLSQHQIVQSVGTGQTTAIGNYELS